MLDFIFNSKYRNSTALSDYQNYIMSDPSPIKVSEVPNIIKELDKYEILFTKVLGIEVIPKYSNLFIRNQIIKSVLYYIIGDKENARKFKVQGDDYFLQLKKGWFYQEGYGYFLYVLDSYKFYSKHVPSNMFGNIDMSILEIMLGYYKKIVCLDGSIPTTDTAKSFKIQPDSERISFQSEMCSVHILNSQSTYIYIEHDKSINNISQNLHVNYRFGHFTVFHDNKHLVLDAGYPGFGLKQKSKIKESYNNNVILDGVRTQENLWRYLPKKPKLEWSYKNNVYNFKIGNEHTRKIEIMNTGVFVTDTGLGISSFNLSDDCKFNYSGKRTDKTGYHSNNYLNVSEHKRTELTGSSRLFFLKFD